MKSRDVTCILLVLRELFYKHVVIIPALMFGFVNKGSICFLNCIVQCLIRILKFFRSWMSHDCANFCQCGKQTELVHL